MPTVELFKGEDRVVVDIGSDPERVWRGKGYSEAGKSAKSVTATPAQEPAQSKQDEPAKVDNRKKNTKTD